MSFGCPRFNSDYQWEIIRECSKLEYIILGGKEKLWKRFLKDYSPNNCISYCDFGKFDGHSYIKLGFEKKRLNKPGFVWYDMNLKQIYQRTPWKHNEYKNFYSLSIGGIKSQLIFHDYIYDNANIFLDRKFTKSCELYNYLLKNKNIA